MLQQNRGITDPKELVAELKKRTGDLKALDFADKAQRDMLIAEGKRRFPKNAVKAREWVSNVLHEIRRQQLDTQQYNQEMMEYNQNRIQRT